jgi:hypothetical protein
MVGLTAFEARSFVFHQFTQSVSQPKTLVLTLRTQKGLCEGCPQSIQPFWITREPAVWPWCKLAAYSSVSSHSPVGLVNRQWDAVDWACEMCDLRFHNDRGNRSASSRQCACPFCGSRAGFFGKSPQSFIPPPLQPSFVFLRLLAFPKAKITANREEICECDSHTVHKLN